MRYISAMSQKMPPFGPILRKFRQDKNLSQEELAARLDISPSYVSRLESGFKTPSLRMVFRLSEALGVKAHEIVRAMED